MSKKKILLMSDDLRMHSGVATVSKDIVMETLNEYDWVQIGGAVKHPEEGQVMESVSGIFNFSFGTYKVQIRGLPDLGQTVGIVDDIKVNPYSYQLYDNFPNPFNPETQIRFEIGAQENVQILIYDILGRQIRYLVNEQYSSGFHVVNWDGTNETGQPVSSGMYIYLLKAGDYMADKKMLFVK